MSIMINNIIWFVGLITIILMSIRLFLVVLWMVFDIYEEKTGKMIDFEWFYHDKRGGKSNDKRHSK